MADSPVFSGRTVFITGASRGIGRAIAENLGRGGANVVIAAKSDAPHPSCPARSRRRRRPWRRRVGRRWR